MLKMLKQLPVQLGISILLAFILGQELDLHYIAVSYSLSSWFIEMLMFLLPLIVFSLILRAVVNIKTGSFSLLLLIFAGVTISNCLALTVAYFFGKITLPLIGAVHSPDFAVKFHSSVPVLFKLHLPQLVGTEKAMMVGIFCGIILSFLNDDNKYKNFVRQSSVWLSDQISFVLSKIFIPFLPIYVFGFCVKLSYDDALLHLFHQYGKIFLFSMLLVVIYIFMLYFVAAKGRLGNASTYLKNMSSAGLTGFSTMSSAATMPVTLKCTEVTTKNKNFADLIIPATANIHMLGDDLTIVIAAMTLLSIFGLSCPDFVEFMPFALSFSIAKLSCVGIPGASVLVILPVLQNYLGFTPEMISILTTIYILQDPFGTAANVMGNGAFALIIQRIFKKARPSIFVNEGSFEKLHQNP